MKFKFTTLFLLISFFGFSQVKSILEVKRPDIVGLQLQKAGESFKGAGAFVMTGIIVSQLFKKEHPKTINAIGYGLGGFGAVLLMKGGFHLSAAGTEIRNKGK